jgi:serine/threonine-protein kinase
LPAVVLAAMTFVAGQGVLLAGRYRLDEPLASGGAGQVWRAVDLVLERPVAVKLLRPEAAAEPEAHARFRAEARNASRLSHPGVAQVYDYGDSSWAEVPFLVMELVDGPSLAAVLAAGPLDPGQTMDLIAQVGAGLHAAHAAGLVHRDIKPANLLITADGQVKITDFGIAHVVPGVPLTASGILVGTPAYLAPERAAGGPATPASDLYSLGVVGYECLTGAPPFRGPALEVAEAHLRCPFPGLPLTVPAEIGAFVAALTAKNPGSRPASAREVAERAGQLRGAGKITSSGAISPVTAPGRSGAAPPLTLTDVSAPPTQASPPVLGGPQAGRRPGSMWKKAGAGLAIVAALTVAGLIGWQAGLAGAARPHGAAAPRQPSPPSVPMVVVSRASLVGQRAGVVLADLRRLGLRPYLAWVPTSAQPPGTVLSVQPSGTLAPETIVTVTVATTPGQQADQKRDGNGGNDGGGGNDGR